MKEQIEVSVQFQAAAALTLENSDRVSSYLRQMQNKYHMLHVQ